MGQIKSEKYNLDVELVDFSQAQFELYQPIVLKASRDSFYAFPNSEQGVTAGAVVRGAIVRAAIKAAFLKGLELENVGNLSPNAITWLSEKIKKHVIEITTAPPDPN